MNQELITTNQEPKEKPVTRGYQDLLDRTASRVRVESSETRAKMEEEDRRARRAQMDSQELWDSKAPQVLQVHRVPEGSEVNQDRSESLDFLDHREDRDQPETPEQPDAAGATDKRANWETPVRKAFQDHRDREECRARMEKMATDLQDPKVSRETPGSQATPVYWAKTA